MCVDGAHGRLPFSSAHAFARLSRVYVQTVLPKVFSHSLVLSSLTRCGNRKKKEAGKEKKTTLFLLLLFVPHGG